MVKSMTGFAAEADSAPDVSWMVEIRGVNAKGLDVRVRAPERMTGFDQTVRGVLQKALSRGNVTVSIRTEQTAGQGAVQLNEDVVEAYLSAARALSERASAEGVPLRESSVAELLALRGVIEASDEGGRVPEPDEVLPTVERALQAFKAMRAQEGEALKAVLEKALDEVADLTSKAAEIADQRKDQMAETLRLNLARVLENTEGVDEDRIAQELALLAVKADVTEEIDRLQAHVGAARALLTEDGPIGRKLDFLMQEFNREANTLCSKSGSTDLTSVGLDLKARIDQMREQVQNVE